jgi:hypothetical protein
MSNPRGSSAALSACLAPSPLQLLFQLFQLQLHLLFWHKDSASAAIERTRGLVELEQWPQELAAFRQQATLHFKILQVDP